jgi:hypothetical protein
MDGRKRVDDWLHHHVMDGDLSMRKPIYFPSDSSECPRHDPPHGNICHFVGSCMMLFTQQQEELGGSPPPFTSALDR